MPISHILPPVLEDEPVWMDLIQTMEGVVGSTADNRIRILLNRHNLEYYTNMQTGLSDENGPKLYVPGAVSGTPEVFAAVKSLAQLTGYAYRDANKLDVDTYLRMIESATSYIPYKGTRKFIDFFSYVINKNLVINPLWYDYSESKFYSENSPALATRKFDAATGSHTAFPTPYVDIEMDPELIKVFTLQELMDLFYSVTSFDIVIRQVVFGYNAPAPSVFVIPGPVDVFTEVNVDPIQTNIPSYPSIIKSGGAGDIFKVTPAKCFTDTAGTIAATFGDKVARVNSVASSSVYAVQTNANYRPTLGRVPKIGRRNRAIYTERFTVADWVKTNLVATDNAAGSTDPQGGNHAGYIAPNTTLGTHYMEAPASVLLPVGTHNISIYAKPDTLSRLYIESNANSVHRILHVDVQFGAIVSNSGFTNAKVQAAAGGWYRISCELTLASPATLQSAVRIGLAQLQNTSFIGDGLSGLYVYGLAVGDALYDYQTVATAFDVTQQGQPSVYYLNFDSNAVLTVGPVTFTGNRRTWFVGANLTNTPPEARTVMNAESGGGAVMSVLPTKVQQCQFRGSSLVTVAGDVSTNGKLVFVASMDGAKQSFTNEDYTTTRFGTLVENYANTTIRIGSVGATPVTTTSFEGQVTAWGWTSQPCSIAEVEAISEWLIGLAPDTLKVG